MEGTYIEANSAGSDHDEPHLGTGTVSRIDRSPPRRALEPAYSQVKSEHGEPEPEPESEPEPSSSKASGGKSSKSTAEVDFNSNNPAPAIAASVLLTSFLGLLVVPAMNAAAMF